MKNSIKIVVILGIAISFFPVCSMQQEFFARQRQPLLGSCYKIKLDELKNLNPLRDISEFHFEHFKDFINPDNSLGHMPLPKDFADEGLALKLGAFKFFDEVDLKKKSSFAGILGCCYFRGTARL